MTDTNEPRPNGAPSPSTPPGPSPQETAAPGAATRPGAKRKRRGRKAGQRGNRLLLVALLAASVISLGLAAGVIYTAAMSGGGRPATVAQRDAIVAEAAVEADAESVEVRLEAARANLKLGEYERALGYADQALELQEGLADVFVIKGDAYAGMGDEENARALYEQAVETNQPAAIDAYLRLATLDQAAGKPEEAIDRLETALTVSPTNASLLVSLGSLYAGSGRLDEARNAYASTLNYVPDMEEAVAGLTALEYGPAKYDLALLAWSKGDQAGAEALMESAVTISPDISWLQVAYGDFHAMTGDTAKARAAYERALELDPDNTEARAALTELQ